MSFLNAIRISAALFCSVMLSGEALSACDPIYAAQMNAVGQSQLDVARKIKSGQCALIPNMSNLTAEANRLAGLSRSPTCAVSTFSVPAGMFPDGLATLKRIGHLARYSDYCGGTAKASRPGKDPRVCSKFQAIDSQTTGNHCIIFHNGCGFTVSAHVVKSNYLKFRGSFTVGATPVTECSGTADWKYIFTSKTDLRID